MIDPIEKFAVWWHEALEDSPLNQKSAVCVSSINANGYPESRFVDLKAVTKEGCVFLFLF